MCVKCVCSVLWIPTHAFISSDCALSCRRAVPLGLYYNWPIYSVSTRLDFHTCIYTQNTADWKRPRTASQCCCVPKKGNNKWGKEHLACLEARFRERGWLSVCFTCVCVCVCVQQSALACMTHSVVIRQQRQWGLKTRMLCSRTVFKCTKINRTCLLTLVLFRPHAAYGH